MPFGGRRGGSFRRPRYQWGVGWPLGENNKIGKRDARRGQINSEADGVKKWKRPITAYAKKPNEFSNFRQTPPQAGVPEFPERDIRDRPYILGKSARRYRR